MTYSIKIIKSCERDIKVLSKRYPSFKADLFKLRELLQNNPTAGVPLGNSCYKIRMPIASKNKGKSGGARIITNVVAISEKDGTIYLLAIFDKSDQENISDHQIKTLLKEII